MHRSFASLGVTEAFCLASFMSQRALTELFRGKGAHADPMACVEDISAEVAARQVAGFPHSIGQLVFHMNYWMEYELRRIRGREAESIRNTTRRVSRRVRGAGACGVGSAARTRMADCWASSRELAKSSPQELQREIESVHEGDKKVAGTLEAVLWQMVAHNSYHVGQIAMMRRALGAWPPRGGGDTW